MNSIAKFSALVLLLHCSPLVQQQSALARTSMTLQAGVQLDEKLPSLDETLAPGNQFNQSLVEQKLRKATDRNQWYRIPSWAAGTWKTSMAQTTSYKDEITGEETLDGAQYTMKSNFDLGVEKDRTGQIWNFVECNYWTRTEYETKYAYTFVTYNAPGQVKNNTLKTESRSVSFFVDKLTGKILSTAQRQSIEIYSNRNTSFIHSKDWHRNFDWHGTVISSAHNENNCIRTDYFEVCPTRVTADNRLLTPLFKEYLKEKGLSHLLPLTANDVYAEINSVVPSANMKKGK